jgi:excisionase family DNA binding protein
MSRALTPRQVAERWQCSERKVRYMVESGALPGFNLDGKLLRLRLEDVEAFECRTGGSRDLMENAALPGTTPAESGDVIDLAQATRKRRPASPRLDTLSLRDRAGKR